MLHIVDSIMMQASLPQGKLTKCSNQLSSCYHMKHITLRDLQSLIGLLNFTCSVIVPDGTFLRRLIDLTKGIHSPCHFVCITKGCKQDIQVWLSFLHQYNGKLFFLPDRWLTSSKLQLYTDAAGSLGYGAVFGKHWFFGSWPDKWKSFNITILELYPIVIFVETWGHVMANRCIVFFTNNRALVDIINKQTPKVFLTRNATCFHAYRWRKSGTTTSFTGELVEHLKLLLQSAISTGSRQTYQQALTVYAKFAEQFGLSDTLSLLLSVNSVALFIAHLSTTRLAPATISTHISAISYVHKLKGYADPTKAFLILRLLSATKSRSHPEKTEKTD